MRPDERSLEELIGAAFDRLPDPDSTRFKELEERLVRQATRGSRSNRHGPTLWWLIAALTATGAAAWWTGEYFSAGSREQEINSRAPETQTTEKLEQGATRDARQEHGNDSLKAEPAKPAHDGPGIYRRERY